MHRVSVGVIHGREWSVMSHDVGQTSERSDWSDDNDGCSGHTYQTMHRNKWRSSSASMPSDALLVRIRVTSGDGHRD